MKRREGWKITVLTAALAWLMLLNEAMVVNVKEKEASVRTAAEPEKKSGVRQEAEAPDAGSTENAGGDTVAGDTEGTENPGGLNEGTAEEPCIRVLLMDSGYESYYHPAVTVNLNGEDRTYTPESPELKEAPVILDGGEAGIAVTSINRQEGYPVYQGTLEISADEKGLLLTNEVPVEAYLEAVVPSEMPASYGAEALMAQAVCARTYAYRQMKDSRLREEYHADVDDSVNFQVYRNISPKEETTAAVRATKGQVLCQNGEPIEAYYFSTSAGMTSTDEIWGADEAAPYLKSVACTFDETQPWSRWSVEIPWSTLAERAALLSGSSGDFVGLEAEKKSQSGAVIQLSVITEEGAAEISGEYAVRQFLSPKGLAVTGNDGASSQGGALLPSAYFSMSQNPGTSVTISGRGYGHGVGMSQTAADEMAEQGYSYREILDYFFNDIQITQWKA